MTYIIDGIPRVNGRAGWLRWVGNTQHGKRRKRGTRKPWLFLDVMVFPTPNHQKLFGYGLTTTTNIDIVIGFALVSVHVQVVLDIINDEKA